MEAVGAVINIPSWLKRDMSCQMPARRCERPPVLIEGALVRLPGVLLAPATGPARVASGAARWRCASRGAWRGASPAVGFMAWRVVFMVVSYRVRRVAFDL